jgi:alpha-1,6-mannosyltransferase
LFRNLQDGKKLLQKMIPIERIKKSERSESSILLLLFQTASVTLVFFLCSLYTFLTPYAKVEESFHLQATHDAITLGLSSEALPFWDHNAFPGVVPRTFIGALCLAQASWPMRLIVWWLRLPKIFLQVGVRLVLGSLVCSALLSFVRAASRRLGASAAIATLFCVASTPHLLYYSSRTLPNTFALFMVLHGCACWLRMRRIGTSKDISSYPLSSTLALLNLPPSLFAIPKPFAPGPLTGAIIFFVLSIIWFRCDMLVLLAPVALSWLLTGKASFPQLIVIGGISGILGLVTTVLIDSHLWGKWLWPEGVVLFFNAVENKSHLWGVMSWHWYFSSALPRSLLLTVLLIPVGCLSISSTSLLQGNAFSRKSTTSEWLAFLSRCLFSIQLDRHVLSIFLPALGFVILYSFLPHKEVRFLIPALPLFFLTAGVGASKLMSISYALLWGFEIDSKKDEVNDDIVPETKEENNLDKHDADEEQRSKNDSSQGSLLRKRLKVKIPTETKGQFSSPSMSPILGELLDLNLGGSPRSARRQSGLVPTHLHKSHKPTGLDKGCREEEKDRVDLWSTSKPRSTPGPFFIRFVGLSIMLFVTTLLAVSMLLTFIYVRVSIDNYPGGRALQFLNSRYSLEMKKATRTKTNKISLTSSWGEGQELPPCPDYDICAAQGSAFEWWRECMGKHCPSRPPWTSIGTIAGSSSTPPTSPACVVPGSKHSRPISVHIDGAAAETGVSRFGEAWSTSSLGGLSGPAGWVYSKAENLTLPKHYKDFDILLTGKQPDFHKERFVLVDSIDGNPTFVWPKPKQILTWFKIKFLRAGNVPTEKFNLFGEIKTEPIIYILRRK